MLWWVHALATCVNMSANMVYTGSICCLSSSLQSGASLVLTGGVVFLTINPFSLFEGEDYNGIHACI